MLRLVWSQLPLKSTTDIAVDALRRSSNSAAVVGKQLFIFGGERVPRVPVDNELWVVGLDDGTVTPAPTSSLRPSARVGASLSYHPGMSALYLWGGRESRDMTPCDTVLWKYSLSSGKWEQSATADKENVAQEDKVAPRSYHAMCTVGNDLYLHAGCPAEGRLATLHSLSLASAQTWSTLPGGPGPGRGGTVLTPITAPGGAPLLVRYGGFAGHELGGRLDLFSPARSTWSSIAMPGEEGRAGHPLARSVHALVPVRPPVALPASAGHGHGHVVAVLLFGERGPAPAHLGHLGAGTFHRDAWALVCTPAEADGHDFAFVELVQEESLKGGGTPPARGWFAADWMQDGGGAVVVHGGLDDENDRLGDVWLGKLEVRA